MHLTRREFNRLSMLGGVAALSESPNLDGASAIPTPTEVPEIQDIVRVAIVKTTNREEGLARAVALLEEVDFSGNDVYLKGSYNSPNPFPATTHPDALGAMVRTLRGKGAGKITFIERSGMGRTRNVMEQLNVLATLKELDVSFCLLDELPAEEWRHFELAGSHWSRGIEFPRFLTQDKCLVQLCNLKTHRFGGEFSASLKNSIGLIAKHSSAAEPRLTEDEGQRPSPGPGWNYMKDLHDSPNQGQMIADANRVHKPKLIVMDAVEVFVTDGPERGETATPEIIAASRDRVALDAVGLAILQFAGARIVGASVRVFEQVQIKRAADLNLGVNSPEKIRVVSDDNAGRMLAARLENLLH